MPAPTKIPNDLGNRIFLMGIQSSPLVPAVPDMRMNGQPDINTAWPLIEDDDVTGTYMGLANPNHGAPVHTGTIAATLSYENLPTWMRLLLESGAAPAISASPAFTYDQEPIILYDDFDCATMQYNVHGDPWQASGIRLSQGNIEASIADANSYWRLGGTLSVLRNDQITATLVTASSGTTGTIVMTGAGWTINQFAGAYLFPEADTNVAGARQIVSNTADTLTVSPALDVAASAGKKYGFAGVATPGIPSLVEEKIVAAGTKLYIDPASGTLGTTQIKQRFISFNVTVNLNLDPKTFMEDEDGPGGVYGRGKLEITFQIRLEADRPDEYRQLKRLDRLGIRIEKLGSDLGGGVRKMARIDIPKAIWTERTKETRNNNLTQTLAGRALLNTPPIRVVTRNGLSVLP
jgi:hypothetical protein